MSTPDEVISVLVGMVTEPGVERDVIGSVAPSMESEDADDDSDKVAESRTGEEIWATSKMELVSESPESRNTRI